MCSASSAPVRTCVICRTKLPKSDMVRIVRGPIGDIKMGLGEKADGRGAYICSGPRCWEYSLKPKGLRRLEYSLRSRLSKEERSLLQVYTESFTSQAGVVI